MLYLGQRNSTNTDGVGFKSRWLIADRTNADKNTSLIQKKVSQTEGKISSLLITHFPQNPLLNQ